MVVFVPAILDQNGGVKIVFNELSWVIDRSIAYAEDGVVAQMPHHLP
jgi:hypothetical protein